MALRKKGLKVAVTAMAIISVITSGGINNIYADSSIDKNVTVIERTLEDNVYSVANKIEYVKDGEIIAKAHNLRENKNSSIAHAEILAIEKANKKLNAWRLENCEMYITLEPCMMCMGAIVNSRIKKIYIGALDPKTGSCKSVINMENYKFNHIVEVETGILQEDCEYILKDFFKMLRKMKRRKK